MKPFIYSVLYAISIRSYKYYHRTHRDRHTHKYIDKVPDFWLIYFQRIITLPNTKTQPKCISLTAISKGLQKHTYTQWHKETFNRRQSYSVLRFGCVVCRVYAIRNKIIIIIITAVAAKKDNRRERRKKERERHAFLWAAIHLAHTTAHKT